MKDHFLAKCVLEAYLPDNKNHRNPHIDGWKTYPVNYRSGRACIFWNDEEIVVAIAGTNDWEDMKENLAFLKTSFMHCDVHEGFLKAYNDIANILREKLVDLFKEKSRKIYLVGHSQGAAMVSFMATQISHDRCVLLGCPRVGDDEYVKYFNYHSPNSIAYINDQDWIPNVPKIGYGRIGKKIVFFGKHREIRKTRRFSWKFIYRKITGATDDHLSWSYFNCLRANDI